MTGDDAGARALVEQVLARPVSAAECASWGFQSHTDLVTLADGRRVVLQRFPAAANAGYRVHVLRGLMAPAYAAGIPIPGVLAAATDVDPSWVILEALPGVPVAAAGDVAPGGPGFPAMAAVMGRLLAAFRQLPTDGLQLDDTWSDATGLAGAATAWAARLPEFDVGHVIDVVPDLLYDRPAVLAHGDFAPVNVLVDGMRVTGLLDFESTRLADPMFDVAWWAWSVSFASAEVLAAAWPGFLAGAGIEPDDPDLQARIEVLQILRMLELLASGHLRPDIAQVVGNRLHAMLP